VHHRAGSLCEAAGASDNSEAISSWGDGGGGRLDRSASSN